MKAGMGNRESEFVNQWRLVPTFGFFHCPLPIHDFRSCAKS